MLLKKFWKGRLPSHSLKSQATFCGPCAVCHTQALMTADQLHIVTRFFASIKEITELKRKKLN